MLTIEEALAAIVANAGRQPVVRPPLESAAGMVLAETVVARSDSPPFAKSMFDGFALRRSDVGSEGSTLPVAATILAGTAPGMKLAPGTAARIMTGAPVPLGADVVVMLEHVKATAEQVEVPAAAVKKSNVLDQGTEFRAGDEVLAAGRVLNPAAVGLLASLGEARPAVFSRPRLAVLATGDEIVPAEETPGPGRIRNSNGPTALALARARGLVAESLGIVGDDREALKERIRAGLAADILILSGGVSAGDVDHVPGVLAELGVEKVFHKVRFKPGQPLWFGKHASGLVFGLPGNPVSVLACFELFVATAIRARSGLANPGPPLVRLPLSAAAEYPTDRPTFHPGLLIAGEHGLCVRLAPWFGSADLRGAAAADCLVELPAGPGVHPAGTTLRVLPLSQSDGASYVGAAEDSG
ncbi:MAG TPA: gephyrin-like molybdotransferase Glp [Planctomycetia bacterium]|nr:gephyrin-like molybdotransferase Glp [Planctomycetia bacterium]